MNNLGLISVILPVRNGEKYIKSAIDSILYQTYPYFELLIINDGSVDSTLNIISKIKDHRIHVFNTKGIGLVEALNLGISKAEGSYIARMDADDICMPDRFEKQIGFLKRHANVGLVFSDILVINEDGYEIGAECEKIRNSNDLRDGLVFKRKMKPVVHPSVMLKTDLLRKVQGYRLFRHAEDRDLWLRLIELTEVYRLNTPLLMYRVNNSGVSKNNSLEQMVNSMLGVLNYEINKKIGVDLFYENKVILDEYYILFLDFANSQFQSKLVFNNVKNRIKSNGILDLVKGGIPIKDILSSVNYYLLNRKSVRSVIDKAVTEIVDNRHLLNL